MSFLSKLIAEQLTKYADETVTVANVTAGVNRVLGDIAAFVADTTNQIDDAVFAELQLDVDFAGLAASATNYVRGMLGLSVGSPSIFAPPTVAAGPPKLFLGLVRARLVAETMKAKGVSRAAARKIVAGITDSQILAVAETKGIGVGAIGDGKILQWLVTHGPELLALVMKLLSLFVLV